MLAILWEFQSHPGPITRSEFSVATSFELYFNPTLVQLQGGREFSDVLLRKFQSHPGQLQVVGIEDLVVVEKHFNPTLVQLQAQGQYQPSAQVR